MEKVIIEKTYEEFNNYIKEGLEKIKNPLPFLIVDTYDKEGVKMIKYIDLQVCPSSYSCALKELLSSDSGRTEDTTYNKMKLGEYVELSVSYRAMSSNDLSIFLNNFSDEYVTICYFDPKKNAYLIDEFYLGETSVPLYNGALGFWDGFSLTLSQRKANTDFEEVKEDDNGKVPSEEV